MKCDLCQVSGRAGGAADSRAGEDASRRASHATRRARSAFTLLEVMIATGILFLCLFAILGLVSNTLRNARTLQHRRVDAGMVAAELCTQFANTNQVSEGSGSGDFGDLYPDYGYEWDLMEITNGLCQLDIVVQRRGQPESTLTVLRYLPNFRRTTP